jgi:FkbM family methyltransferase
MLKRIFLNAIPFRFQVPLKYFYSQARGWLEPEMALLPKLVNAEDSVIDIGGNWGLYAYSLSALKCRVAVFEPNPQCFRALNSWASGKRNVDVFAAALSSHHGKGQLHIPVDSTGQEHDASASLNSRCEEVARRVEVEIITLDSLDFRDVKFIKIDVEGHELDALKGATKTILSSLPVMLIEIEQRHNTVDISDIFSFIACLGYDGFYLDGKILKNIHSFDLARDQPALGTPLKGGRYINNFLFIPSDSAWSTELALRLPFAK